MKALLDTHTFLWWNTNDPQLSPVVRAFIMDGRNEIFFSAISAWEIVIKVKRGRLELPEPVETYLLSRIRLHSFQLLPIQFSHTLQVSKLPELHRDPFDRILIAQAQVEEQALLSSDEQIKPYDVKRIW
jgi:PIN domain nuclease of toxin-antitoxin system